MKKLTQKLCNKFDFARKKQIGRKRRLTEMGILTKQFWPITLESATNTLKTSVKIINTSTDSIFWVLIGNGINLQIEKLVCILILQELFLK